jgi:hypothetical protein
VPDEKDSRLFSPRSVTVYVIPSEFSGNSILASKDKNMLINSYTRFGFVEGLGDEEIPWWIAPYVRDFAALAKSTAVL